MLPPAVTPGPPGRARNRGNSGSCQDEAGLTVPDPALHSPVIVPAKVSRPAALVLALALALGLAGCITPSIPIPPPEPALMRFPVDVATGTATFSYPPEVNYGGAIVYVYNRSREVGIIARARPDGSVGPTMPFPAGDGDNVVVTFQTDDDATSTCVVIGTASPVPNNFCTL